MNCTRCAHGQYYSERTIDGVELVCLQCSHRIILEDRVVPRYDMAATLDVAPMHAEQASLTRGRSSFSTMGQTARYRYIAELAATIGIAETARRLNISPRTVKRAQERAKSEVTP